MDTAVSRPELLLVADAVAREKSIDREEVLEAMEQQSLLGGGQARIAGLGRRRVPLVGKP